MLSDYTVSTSLHSATWYIDIQVSRLVPKPDGYETTEGLTMILY